MKTIFWNLYFMKFESQYFINENNIDLITKKFKILSEESRLRILQVLQDGEKSVSQIVIETGFLQANVSKQLKILLDADIIKRRTEGKHHYYSILDTKILKICQIICSQE